MVTRMVTRVRMSDSGMEGRSVCPNEGFPGGARVGHGPGLWEGLVKEGGASGRREGVASLSVHLVVRITNHT